MNLSLEDFIKDLFSKSPPMSSSININMDEQSLGNFFGMLIQTGTEILFGVTFNMMSEEQCQILNKYVNSLGYNATYKVITDNDKLSVSVEINKL